MKTHAVIIFTEAVNVTCPLCGDFQPNPRDGSHLWTPEDIAAKRSAPMKCVGCDAALRFGSTRTARIEV